jgi:hypothetical protein
MFESLFTPTERPRTVRQGKAHLRARVNGNLALRFTGHGLTSFAGLELVRQFLQRLEFSRRLGRHLHGRDPAGDFSSVAVVRLILAMLMVGARRLWHIRHLVSDPVIHRFCGLAVLPGDRTLSRWLSRCVGKVRAALQALNGELIAEVVQRLELKRITLDVDGTVVSTGLSVERAFRGYNPHHRKVKSYYPITAYLAQTGHVMRVRNRSGNVHDGKASLPFLRDLLAQVARFLGRQLTIEMRLDGALFRPEIVAWLRSRAAYAIKVPFYPWLGLKLLIQRQHRWTRLAADLEAFEARVAIPTWKRSLRVAIYRRRVQHESPKNFQLDLFDPDDGHWEYSAITTNQPLGLRALSKFMAGRGTHEKVLAQLKNGYAFDTVPTRNFAANSTWQILSVLAHNLITNFQIALAAPPRRSSSKRRSLFLLRSIHTLRYELLGRAGMVRRPEGRAVLTLAPNLPTQKLFERIVAKLASAA